MKHYLLAMFIVLPMLLFGQQKFTISGYVEDSDSGEKLLGVNIYDANSGSGTVSNTYGFYSLTLPKDSIILSISYVGYDTRYYKAYLDKDISMNFKMGSDVALEEVVVVGEKFEKIEEETRMSTVGVPIETIKSIPALLGETDVLKVLQLLPGVQSGGEGQSGLYVRGGSPDQNLILLDGVPVYNASHLFGFFSVFNADAVKDVTLTKGGFPARYGGRLSSVIEINMKEGDKDDWHGTGSIGLIASKLTIEGPIVKDKTSLLLSGRRTYIDVLARPLIKAQSEGQSEAGYFFDDINAKINHKFSEKDRLFLSLYTGRDKFGLTERYDFNGNENKTGFGLQWGNLTGSMRWNHLWSNKLFSNATLTYSKYKFTTSALDEYSFDTYDSEFSLDYDAGIEDVGAKIDFDWVPNPNHFIRFGGSVVAHDFNPGLFNIFSSEKENDVEVFKIDTVLGQKEVYATELAVYVEDDMKIGERLKANVGIHVSGFNVRGKNYASFQPRIGLRYLLDSGLAIKASYSQMRQYIQLLTNEGIGLPTDLWLPSTDKVLPQDSWQAAIGVAKTVKKDYEVSFEAYYKEMSNLTAYKEGSSFFQLGPWEDRITQGSGTSYGGEFLVQKKKGRLTGWVGYTLSWSFRQFPGLNLGREFPFKYDRRHDISVVGTYKINERISVAGTWVYGTGNAVTLANSVYNGDYSPVELIQQGEIPVTAGQNFFGPNRLEFYNDRNDFRMRAYHRLDVGVTFTKQKKRYKRTWAFGAYNTYNRKNPFFIFVGSDPQTDKNVLKQASLFPVIPYFSWKFEF